MSEDDKAEEPAAEIEASGYGINIARKVFDHVTDIVAITGIAAVSIYGNNDPYIIGAMTTIALGKHYAMSRRRNEPFK